MCMGCMTSADFVVTSGVLGAASLRVGARRLLPTAPRWARKVSDREAAAFVASLAPAAGPSTADAAAGVEEPASDDAKVPAGR